jgi:dolichol-phosphate mannosyltransferase
LTTVLSGLPYPYEIIVINDGSTDESLSVLRSFAAGHPEVKLVDFRRNYGQTAALMAGIDSRQPRRRRHDRCRPSENDPADIPRLLAKARRSYDVVSGWRKDRKDAQIRRNWVSAVSKTS